MLKLIQLDAHKKTEHIFLCVNLESNLQRGKKKPASVCEMNDSLNH